MDTVEFIHLIKDTIHVVLNNSHEKSLIAKSDSSDYRYLYTAISTLIGSILGSWVTYWAKTKEFKNIQENLNIQKQLFEETKKNNEYHISIETKKLEDLRMQYELSLKKFDFEHLKELLEFAYDKNEKLSMLSDFTSILSKFNPEIPSWVNDADDFHQIVVDHTYYRLEDIEKDITNLLEKHVATFASLHKNFLDVSSQANFLIRQKSQITMHMPDVDDEFIIHKYFDSLLKLYVDYNNLLDLLQEEFVELDKVKRDFILERSKK